ncbi:MAG: hypothetical protein ABIF22_01560 [bacterium]
MVAQVIKKQIEKIEYREKKIFGILFSVFVFFTMSYGFLLNSTMMNAVSRQSMEKEMVSLGSDVNSLEFQYLNIKNSITLGLAQSKGFISISLDKFAVIDSTQKKISLSINEN